MSDVWNGLWRAKQLDWVSFAPGRFDADQYKLLEDPLNADMHEVRRFLST